MLTLAQQAVKLPIFKMFVFARSEYARLIPNKNGSVVVKFSDNSHFTLLPDGTMKTTWFIQYGKELYYGLHGYFLASSQKDAISQADDKFSNIKSYWEVCKREHILTIDMAGCPIQTN